jgi:hypothetical protein
MEINEIKLQAFAVRTIPLGDGWGAVARKRGDVDFVVVSAKISAGSLKVSDSAGFTSAEAKPNGRIGSNHDKIPYPIHWLIGMACLLWAMTLPNRPGRYLFKPLIKQ